MTSDKGEKTAILFEPNDPNLPAEHITYNQLYKRVNRFANVLKSNGILMSPHFKSTGMEL